ncbi:Sperm motility kinase 3 [Choanephora cucurbitarum]|uniref:Sperm motility kinase 3 n=1 Tax=Choanephora cucurbitarum TaxID=101091 RepID=A0A1C7NP01_9FUNG|nr:Sperm motility kinase 3 [Choanephora cucurbitarum]
MNLVGLLRGANDNNKDFLAGIYDSRDAMKLGRKIDNDVIIDWHFVSELHCEIHTSSNRDSTNVYLTDKSLNGTFFNGSLIGYNKSVILYSGSVISFASSHLNLLYIGIDDKNHSQDENFNVVLQKEPAEHSKEITVINKPIGSGAESTILLAYHSLKSRYEIVCKSLRKHTWKRWMNKVSTEVDFLKKARHPNVLSIIGSCGHPTIKTRECVFYPLYAGGSLYERIKRKQYLEEEEASFLFFQVLHGLKSKHHPLRQNDRTRAVIGDFGLARQNNGNLWADEQYGTWLNHAPEIVKQEQYDERIDVWSAGIVLYLMLSGDHPFLESSEFRERHIESLDKVRDRIAQMDPLMRRKRIQECSSETQYLILSLLEKDPKKRYTASEALKDAFFLNKTVTDQRSFFEDYQTYVKEDFEQEREIWFDEKDDEDQSNYKFDQGILHPDDDDEQVSNLIKYRSSRSLHPIFKAKYAIEVDDDRFEEISNLLLSEQNPKASFRNNKRSSLLSENDSDNDNNKPNHDEEDENEGFSVCAS